MAAWDWEGDGEMKEVGKRNYKSGGIMDIFLECCDSFKDVHIDPNIASHHLPCIHADNYMSTIPQIQLCNKIYPDLRKCLSLLCNN